MFGKVSTNVWAFKQLFILEIENSIFSDDVNNTHF